MKKHRKFLIDLQTSEQFYNDQESRKIIGELIAMIDEGFNKQPKADWIPCSKQSTPNEDGVYIISGHWRSGKEYVGEAEYIGEWKVVYEFTIDAWMPKPQPYKKEGNSNENT